MSLKILYEDDKVAVIEKPAGVVVMREGPGEWHTIAEELSEYKREFRDLGEDSRFGIVHRLDKDTSGVLLCAKTREVFLFFQEQFRRHETQKEYVCLVVGDLKQDSGLLHTLLDRSPSDRRKQRVLPLGSGSEKGEREAITEYHVAERFGAYTLLVVRPKTGRKHQIRAHMAHLGHPIAGDKLYGFKNQPAPNGLKRQFLHASSLAVRMPDGSQKEFRSDLPEDLSSVLAKLRTGSKV